jgi:peptide/nickel transport system permease protein
LFVQGVVSLIKLIARRLLTMIPIILGVVLIAMLLLQLSPNDPAATLAGEGATPEAIAAVRHELHLDQPLLERYIRYVGGMVHGDLGRSPVGNVSVWGEISKGLPVTLSLTLAATVLAAGFGVAGGLVAALRQGRLADRVVNALASLMLAVPPFVIGLALVILLAVDRAILPAGGYVPLATDPWQWLRHVLLPASTLALPVAASIARQTRAALLDTLDQDFIRALRAKGLRERSVIGKHAAKNAATPVITVLGLSVGTILGGSVVVETIYAQSGFGTLAVNAVLTQDLPMVQGVVVVAAVFVLLANLLVDVSYGYFNPKARA